MSWLAKFIAAKASTLRQVAQVGNGVPRPALTDRDFRQARQAMFVIGFDLERLLVDGLRSGKEAIREQLITDACELRDGTVRVSGPDV